MTTENQTAGSATITKQPPVESPNNPTGENGTNSAAVKTNTEVAQLDDQPYDDSSAIDVGNAHVVPIDMNAVNSVSAESWSAPAAGLSLMPESFGREMTPVLNIGDKYRVIPHRCAIEEMADLKTGEMVQMQASYFYALKFSNGKVSEGKPIYYRTSAVLLAKAIATVIRDGLAVLANGQPKLFEVTFKGKHPNKNYDLWDLVPV